MSSNHLPPVELFTTSILSNHKVRSRHERYTSVLAVKKIPFVYHDLASDEDAKSRWRRKAKDPQIPGLLVHNEWRGTFEEFEEAVEFGELNLFLNIDPSRSLPPIPTQSSTSPAIQSEPSTSNSTSTSTSSVKLKPMPTAMPQMAPAGSGKREETAEDLMASLSVELDEFNLSESDVSTLLEEMELEAQADRSARSIKSSEETIGESKDQNQNQNGLGSRSISTSSSSSSKIGLGQPPPRTYIPSSDAGVKPLRFARMGSGNMEPQSMTDRASSINLNRSPTDSNSNSASSNRSSSMFSSNSNADARYSSSSRSTKALAAEASALASSRNFSSKSFKESMKSGKDLQDALRSASSSNALDQHVVGKETAEDLLASLGLGDLDLTEEEAEKFLLDGEVPDGLDESGYRFKESKKNHLNKADRAREEVAAREVAQRARDRGHLPRDSTGSRSSIITTGSSKSNASNGKEEMIANPQEASEVKDAVEEQKKNDVEMKDEAEEKKDLQEEMKDLEKEKVEQKKDVDEGNQAQDVTAVETSASSDKDSKEQTVEPEVKDESQDTVIQPLNQQDLTSSDTKDLSPTPGSLSTSPLKAQMMPTPSGVVSAAPQDQDQDPTSGKPETDSEKVLDSTSTAQDQKAEVTKENDAENSEKLSEKVASLPADSVTVPESSESAAAASDSKPSIETPIAQSLEDESLGKLNPEEVKKDQKPSAAEETSSATTDPTSTATTALEEKTPKGAAAELQSETEQLPSSTPSTEPPLPTNASSTSLSSRKR